MFPFTAQLLLFSTRGKHSKFGCLEVKKVSGWESSPLLCLSLLAGRPVGQQRQSPRLSLLTWGHGSPGHKAPVDQTLTERMKCC